MCRRITFSSSSSIAVTPTSHTSCASSWTFTRHRLRRRRRHKAAPRPRNRFAQAHLCLKPQNQTLTSRLLNCCRLLLTWDRAMLCIASCVDHPRLRRCQPVGDVSPRRTPRLPRSTAQRLPTQRSARAHLPLSHAPAPSSTARRCTRRYRPPSFPPMRHFSGPTRRATMATISTMDPSICEYRMHWRRPTRTRASMLGPCFSGVLSDTQAPSLLCACQCVFSAVDCSYCENFPPRQMCMVDAAGNAQWESFQCPCMQK